MKKIFFISQKVFLNNIQIEKLIKSTKNYSLGILEDILEFKNSHSLISHSFTAYTVKSNGFELKPFFDSSRDAYIDLWLERITFSNITYKNKVEELVVFKGVNLKLLDLKVTSFATADAYEKSKIYELIIEDYLCSFEILDLVNRNELILLELESIKKGVATFRQLAKWNSFVKSFEMSEFIEDFDSLFGECKKTIYSVNKFGFGKPFDTLEVTLEVNRFHLKSFSFLNDKISDYFIFIQDQILSINKDYENLKISNKLEAKSLIKEDEVEIWYFKFLSSAQRCANLLNFYQEELIRCQEMRKNLKSVFSRIPFKN
jgi:hypothetical protein